MITELEFLTSYQMETIPLRIINLQAKPIPRDFSTNFIFSISIFFVL